MKSPIWVEREAILLLHSTSLARFGGGEGLRDEGLLSSALARPQDQFHYGRAQDLADLAAAYAFGLVKNHPFVDGNKRAGFLACGVFLELNGISLAAPADEAIAAAMALAADKLDEPGFAAWLRKHIS